MPAHVITKLERMPLEVVTATILGILYLTHHFIHSYVLKLSRVEQAVMSSPLMHIEGFLLALTNPDKDGRIVINKKSKTAQPIKHLQETKIPRHKSC